MKWNKCIVESWFDLQTTNSDYTAPKNKMQEERGGGTGREKTRQGGLNSIELLVILKGKSMAKLSQTLRWLTYLSAARRWVRSAYI